MQPKEFRIPPCRPLLHPTPDDRQPFLDELGHGWIAVWDAFVAKFAAQIEQRVLGLLARRGVDGPRNPVPVDANGEFPRFPPSLTDRASWRLHRLSLPGMNALAITVSVSA